MLLIMHIGLVGFYKIIKNRLTNYSQSGKIKLKTSTYFM